VHSGFLVKNWADFFTVIPESNEGYNGKTIKVP